MSISWQSPRRVVRGTLLGCGLVAAFAASNSPVSNVPINHVDASMFVGQGTTCINMGVEYCCDPPDYVDCQYSDELRCVYPPLICVEGQVLHSGCMGMADCKHQPGHDLKQCTRTLQNVTVNSCEVTGEQTSDECAVGLKKCLYTVLTENYTINDVCICGSGSTLCQGIPSNPHCPPTQ
jgi:hypothetical protein